eukprot:5455129-Pyramimonas_sp.AAC.1
MPPGWVAAALLMSTLKLTPRGQIYRPRVRCAAAWAGQAAAPAPSGGSSRVPQGGATVTGTGTVTGTATVTVTGTAS